MTLSRMLGALVLAGAVGCAELPKDAEGTLDRVRAEGLFRVGIVASGADPGQRHQQHQMIRGVVAATAARAAISMGPSERLLVQLEQGEIDLVLGALAPDSPWSKRVTLLPPLEQPAEGDAARAPVLHAAARNGENAWIKILYREAQAVAEPQS